jgi:hypothetical protein
MATMLLGCYFPAAAQPRIRTEISPSAGITDTTSIRFSITVEGAAGDVRAGALPKMVNLRRLNGPSRGQNVSMINGRTRSSYSFSWSLAARGPGPATIPPVTIMVDGVEYHTDPIRFQVVKGATGSSDASELPIFLAAELAEDEVHVGEPVLMTLTLYTRVQVSGLHWIDEPALPAFWVESLPTDPDEGRYVAEFGGEQYYAYTLDRRFLVPASPGDHIITPYSLQLTVPTRRSNDLFGDFFNRQRGQEMIRRSEPVTLKVLPLPETGRPESFSGAVGEFLMSAELDRSEAAVDDVVALRVTVEGDGFLKSAQAPALHLPEGLRTHDPKSEESLTTRNGRMISRKTWEWLLVPVSTGEIPIPDIRFGWLDSRTGQYREQIEGGLTLKVFRGEAGDPVSSGGRLRTATASIAYIKPIQSALYSSVTRVHEKGWFVFMMFAPVFFLPGFILLRRRFARMSGDVRRVRARKAWSKAKKRLAAARKVSTQVEVHESIGRTIVEFVADHFDRSPAGLTYDAVENLLVSRAVNQELIERTRRCLETCDFARYVPRAGESDRVDELFTDARDILERLEKAL